MSILRTWILTVTAAAIVLATAQALMPEGAVKRVGRLTAGLILVLALLQPLTALDRQEIAGLGMELPAGTEEKQEDLMGAIIEQELAAYIVDKGREQGAEVTASVTCVPDENGVPVPRRAVITGELTPAQREALTAVLDRDLGIPAGSQTYREG